MLVRHRLGLALAVGLSLLAAPHVANAFCGFYVSGADAKLFNNATQVVMMRDGTRTVLSMQNNYEGPPSDFAMVVPVPVVLQKENVKTLPRELFDKIDQLTAPRLVEYWEQDPCGGYADYSGLAMRRSAGASMAKGAPMAEKDLGVTVEARFDVGEYDVVILSAKDSGGLDTWLRQEKYKIPDGAEPFLKPYVTAGSKFFVAKVDPKRVTFEKGQAVLSPLRFHYDATEFVLPVRLGLINSKGTQDLIVNILGSTRFEPANYPTVTIPTNLDLAEGSKEQFGRFYTALYDKTLEKTPKAIVTEYAWDASTCDPCPGPALNPEDFATLGADALPGAAPATNPRVTVSESKGTASAETKRLVPNRFLGRVQQCWSTAQARKPATGRVEIKLAWGADGAIKDASLAKNETNDKELGECVLKPFQTGQMPPEEGNMTIAYALALAPQVAYRSWTITRLHARYSKESLGEDIVLKAADAITGGREVRSNNELEHGSTKASVNNFQGRYAIRHPWVGPIDCKEPHRGVWGGPWYDLHMTNAGPTAAQKLASVPRGGVTLTSFVRTDVPEIGVKAGKGPLPPSAVAAPTSNGDGTAAPASSAGSEKRAGCSNCSSTSRGAGTDAWLDFGGAFGVLALVRAIGRRRGTLSRG